MKCPMCNGSGKCYEQKIRYQEIETNRTDFTIAKCHKCNGTGEVEQTNEDWFSSMHTEAKAKWLADHMKCSKCPQQNRCNGYHGGCVALMLEWLKQPHTAK